MINIKIKKAPGWSEANSRKNAGGALARVPLLVRLYFTI